MIDFMWDSVMIVVKFVCGVSIILVMLCIADYTSSFIVRKIKPFI